MTGRPPRTDSASRRVVGRRLLLAAVTAGIAVIVAACGADYYEIPIETPIQPKLDVSAFQRVLVAGFVAGGSEDVDANQETVRLLRSQLRTKSWRSSARSSPAAERWPGKGGMITRGMPSSRATATACSGPAPP